MLYSIYVYIRFSPACLHAQYSGMGNLLTNYVQGIRKEETKMVMNMLNFHNYNLFTDLYLHR